MSRVSRVFLVLSACALVIPLAGCNHSGSGPGSGADGKASLSWPRAGDPLPVRGLTWAKGHTVHLPDGTTIDTEQPIGDFVVAGDAVYFTPAESTREDGDDSYPRLHRATTAGVEKLKAPVTEFYASPDGRYLVYLDPESGPKDDYGTAVTTLVAVDTRAGKETIRSTKHLGTTDDEISALYEDNGVSLLAVTSKQAYVSDPYGDIRAVDLATGDEEGVEPSEVPDHGLDDKGWNASHQWQIQETYDVRDTLLGEDGKPVKFRTGTPPHGWVATQRRDIVAWIDDSTLAMIAIERDSLDLPDGKTVSFGNEEAVLMTCTVPAGRCERVPGARAPVLDLDDPLPFRFPSRTGA